MFIKTVRAFTLAALAIGAFAQTQTGISAQCESALTTLSKDSEISVCLGSSNLQALALAFVGNSTESLIGPLNTWLSGICAVPACSDATIKKVTDNLTKDCEVEVPAETAKFYPAARKAFCLQQSGTNCLVQTLTSIEKIIGTINLGTITTLDGGEKLLENKGSFCTDCTKAIYTSIVTDFPTFDDYGYGEAISGQCGASYIDKVTPVGIVAATESPQSGALRAFSALSGSLAAIGASSALAVVAFLA